MSTPLILVSGGCIGLGIVILLWRLVPTTPDLGAAMKTFGGTDRRYSDTTATGQQAQIESWFYTHMPAALWPICLLGTSTSSVPAMPLI